MGSQMSTLTLDPSSMCGLWIASQDGETEWRFDEKIGTSRTGDAAVYTLIDTTNKLYTPLVAKVSSRSLEHEFEMMKCMILDVGIPYPLQLHKDFGKNHLQVIIMIYTGFTLKYLYELGILNHGAVATISSRALIRLEHVHMRGFVHNDVKPSHFTIELLDECITMVTLLDYGDACPIGETLMNPVGTPLFMSPDAHRNLYASSKNDLWGLMVTMMYLTVGEHAIPWYDACNGDNVDDAYVATLKEQWSIAEFCTTHKLPEEFQQFFEYVQSLPRDETPDYAGWAYRLVEFSMFYKD